MGILQCSTRALLLPCNTEHAMYGPISTWPVQTDKKRRRRRACLWEGNKGSSCCNKSITGLQFGMCLNRLKQETHRNTNRQHQKGWVWCKAITPLLGPMSSSLSFGTHLYCESYSGCTVLAITLWGNFWLYVPTGCSKKDVVILRFILTLQACVVCCCLICIYQLKDMTAFKARGAGKILPPQ